MNNVVKFYEKYDEDDRLSTNKARKIEFITSVNVLDKYINKSSKVLDEAAGTGAYSFYYSKKGNDVTAFDITPKYIQIIKDKMKKYGCKMTTRVNDATDLSCLESNKFDVVLCMGPMYHLLEYSARKKCMEESLRVLKRGGILAVAYINKYYILQTALGSKKFMKKDFFKKILETGVIKEGEEDCFWTDAYFTSPEEIEKFAGEFDVKVIDHAAVDGLSPLEREKIDNMTDEEYKVWTDYQLETCRVRSLLGTSNHGLLILKKN